MSRPSLDTAHTLIREAEKLERMDPGSELARAFRRMAARATDPGRPVGIERALPAEREVGEEG